MTRFFSSSSDRPKEMIRFLMIASNRLCYQINIRVIGFLSPSVQTNCYLESVYDGYGDYRRLREIYSERNKALDDTYVPEELNFIRFGERVA